VPNQYGAITDRGISNALQKRFGVDPSLNLSLMPEFSAGFTFPSDELFYHLGWRRWSVASNIAAVAAQSGRAQIRVPDAANVLVVVESVLITVAAAAEITAQYAYGPGNIELATINNSVMPRDGRMRPAGGTISIISQTTSAVFVTQIGIDMAILANTPTYLPGAPWVMLPGNLLIFGNTAVNSSMNYTMTFRERMLNDQENVP